MKLVAAGAAGRRDIDVSADPVQSTVGDLACALDGTAAGGEGLAVEGLWAPGDLSLLEAGVHEGAIVGADRLPPQGAPPVGLVEVAVEAGLHAGLRFPLGVGTHLVGRAPEAGVLLDDATVSRQHCVLEVGPDGSVRIWDRSSSGTFVDGRRITDPVPLRPDAVVETGAVAWTVRTPIEQDRLTGTDRFRDLTPAGLINLNRPPRFAPPAGPEKLTPPKPPSKANTAPFSLVAIIAPAVMGAVMVFVAKSVYFLAFAGLSPIMALGNWWESKHRSTKALRSDTRRYAADLETFEHQLGKANEEAKLLRRTRTPDLAEVLRRATAPSEHLWERRLGHGDFGALTAGIGDISWAPELAHPSNEPLPEEVAARLEQYGTLVSAPLAVELAAGGVVGVVGERASALAVARSLLVQAAVHHGPADLRIAVAAVNAVAPA
ncbi:MAG: FHA domain-containing protein, partial [Acidimicrobiaceae bacterium]|nr:FHA domain-containing protein [Acidimicrobiaceae bacterium]